MTSPRPDSFLRRAFWPLLVATLVVIASGHSQVAAPDVIGIDKLAHFTVFAWFSLLVTRFLPTDLPASRQIAIAILLCSVFGATDEWHQSLTPGRSVEFADWIADTIGASAGAFAYTRLTALRRWLEAEPAPLIQHRSV